MSCAVDYDAQFAARFSSEDAEFQRYRKRAPDLPPVLEHWRAARGRRDRRAPEQRGHEHGREHERRYDRSPGGHAQRKRY